MKEKAITTLLFFQNRLRTWRNFDSVKYRNCVWNFGAKISSIYATGDPEECKSLHNLKIQVTLKARVKSLRGTKTIRILAPNASQDAFGGKDEWLFRVFSASWAGIRNRVLSRVRCEIVTTFCKLYSEVNWILSFVFLTVIVFRIFTRFENVNRCLTFGYMKVDAFVVVLSCKIYQYLRANCACSYILLNNRYVLPQRFVMVFDFSYSKPILHTFCLFFQEQ